VPFAASSRAPDNYIPADSPLVATFTPQSTACLLLVTFGVFLSDAGDDVPFSRCSLANCKLRYSPLFPSCNGCTARYIDVDELKDINSINATVQLLCKSQSNYYPYACRLIQAFMRRGGLLCMRSVPGSIVPVHKQASLGVSPMSPVISNVGLSFDGGWLAMVYAFFFGVFSLSFPNWP
jgi:hypothetical protein